MKSKIIIVGIAMIMVLSLAGQGFAGASPFKDLADIPEKAKILELQGKGIVKGIGDGLFAPRKPITAAQSIQLYVNAFGLNIDEIRFIKEPKAADFFVNADNDAWYAEAFIIASFKVPDLPKNIKPNQRWSKEEFTYYLIQALEKQYDLPMIKLVPLEIVDEDQLTLEYSGAIQRAISYGIVELDGDKKFNPKDEITRAEAAVQICNALDYVNFRRI